jgi:hypothetical protein
MDSRRAILPDALRVNANPLPADLCRSPDSMDGGRSNILVGWIPAIHAGMTTYLYLAEVSF